MLLVLSFNLFNELILPNLRSVVPRFSFGIAKVGIFSLPPNFFHIFLQKFLHLYSNRAKNVKIGLKMISLWQIFLVFAKIGAFTIGGGIPMIAAIKSELVERKWLNDEDFIDIITLAQTAPGLFAVNISILTGHRLRGTKGSVVATIAHRKNAIAPS